MNYFSGRVLAVTEVSVAVVLVWGGKYMRDVGDDVRKSGGMGSQRVANVGGGLGEGY